jgi:hypothetical protein
MKIGNSKVKGWNWYGSVSYKNWGTIAEINIVVPKKVCIWNYCAVVCAMSCRGNQ